MMKLIKNKWTPWVCSITLVVCVINYSLVMHNLLLYLGSYALFIILVLSIVYKLRVNIDKGE